MTLLALNSNSFDHLLFVYVDLAFTAPQGKDDIQGEEQHAG